MLHLVADPGGAVYSLNIQTQPPIPPILPPRSPEVLTMAEVIRTARRPSAPRATRVRLAAGSPPQRPRRERPPRQRTPTGRRRDLEQERSDEPPRPQGDDHAERDPGQHYPQSVAHDQPDNVMHASTQGAPHTHLVGPLSDGVCEHVVETNHPSASARPPKTATSSPRRHDCRRAPTISLNGVTTTYDAPGISRRSARRTDPGSLARHRACAREALQHRGLNCADGR